MYKMSANTKTGHKKFLQPKLKLKDWNFFCSKILYKIFGYLDIKFSD